MRLHFKCLVFFAVTQFAGLGFCSDITIFVVKVDDSLDARLSMETFDMGSIAHDKKKTMSLQVRNDSGEDVKVESWRSPCSCLKFNGTVNGLPAGSQKEVEVTLEGENYRGEFLKHMFIPFRGKNGKLKKDFFLPIKFAVREGGAAPAPSSPIPEADGLIKFAEYEGGGFERYKDATAWIFAGKACPNCETLKREILPKLLDSESIDKAEIVLVDIDKKENFMLMVDLEGKTGDKGDKTPVLFWKNKLFHGNEKIKELIGGRQ